MLVALATRGLNLLTNLYRQTYRTPGRVTGWARSQHSDLWKLLSIALFISLGFHQVLKPFCNGAEHSLPHNSLLAGLYPCNGSLLARSWALLTNPVAIWWDLARLRGDQWTTAETFFLWPRIFCVLFLRRRQYEAVAPFLAIVNRGLASVTFLVLAFINTNPPTNVGWWGINTFPFMDISFNCMFPTTVTLEVLYGIWSIAYTLIIGFRYHKLFPDIRFHLPWRLLGVAASTTFLVWLQALRRHEALARRRRSLEEKRASSQAAIAATLASAPGISSSASASALKNALYSSKGLEGSVASSPLMPTMQYTRSPAMPRRHRSICVKIKDAEPEHIQAGYRERIASVIAAANLDLIDVYVRCGCIELIVDVCSPGDGDSAAGGPKNDCVGDDGALPDQHDVDIGALIRALQLPDWTGDDLEDVGQQPSVCDPGFTTSLQTSISTASVSTAAMGSASTPSAGAEFSGIFTGPRLLSADTQYWGLEQPAQQTPAWTAPRILHLQPRVIAIPSSTTLPDSAAASADSPGAQSQPVSIANLLLSVAWPHHGTATATSAVPITTSGEPLGGPSRELVLRSQSMYLPISVDCSDNPLFSETHGSEDAGQFDSTAAPDVAQRVGYTYDVQLAGMPPGSGLILVEARADRMTSSRPVPVLFLDSQELASELVTSLSAWRATDEELDALLVDLGSFLDQVAALLLPGPMVGSSAAGVSVPSAGYPAGDCPKELTGSRRRRLLRMGEHLEAYAAACGWSLMSARIRQEMECLRQTPPQRQPSSHLAAHGPCEEIFSAEEQSELVSSSMRGDLMYDSDGGCVSSQKLAQHCSGGAVPPGATKRGSVLGCFSSAVVPGQDGAGSDRTVRTGVLTWLQNYLLVLDCLLLLLLLLLPLFNFFGRGWTEWDVRTLAVLMGCAVVVSGVITKPLMMLGIWQRFVEVTAAYRLPGLAASKSGDVKCRTVVQPQCGLATNGGDVPAGVSEGKEQADM